MAVPLTAMMAICAIMARQGNRTSGQARSHRRIDLFWCRFPMFRPHPFPQYTSNDPT